MKDFEGHVQYKNHDYRLAFNLNVMEIVQEKYGSLEAWVELTDGVAYAKKAYEEKNKGKFWEDLPAKDKAVLTKNAEPNAKAVIFGFTEMINEGIEIENEENGTNIPPMTLKQVGRMISDIGLGAATAKLNETVIESTKGEEKNE